MPSTTGGTPPRWRDAPAADRRLAPVAVALDAPDIDVAAHWATLVTPYVSTVKIGLELYLRYGPAVVATVRGGSGVQVFLDLKLHDIPNTVAGAARAVSKLRPEILTVHAAGGADMIKAAVEAAPDTLVAGVTLLTSMGDKDLAELGIDGTVSDAVRRMAALAVSAGARGLVCSPQEVAAVRAEVGPDILLDHPGHPPGRRHERRPGQGRHPGGGAQGGRGPPGDRAPHHQGRRPRGRRGRDRGIPAPRRPRAVIRRISRIPPRIPLWRRARRPISPSGNRSVPRSGWQAEAAAVTLASSVSS